MLLATALIGSVVNRESCTISFIVTFADYVYLYDVHDSKNKLLISFPNIICLSLSLVLYVARYHMYDR